MTHGQFAFTTKEAGQYLACFWPDRLAEGDLSINLDWKTGIDAKDWESVAKREKIEVYCIHIYTFKPSLGGAIAITPLAFQFSLFNKMIFT